MVFIVSDKCTKCKRCVEVCPMGTLHEGDDQVVINPDDCIGCGTCAIECPMKAICSESEACEEHIEFNKENSCKWPKAE